MKRGNPDIDRERATLLALCAAQRDDLATLVGQLEAPLKIADRGIAVARYVRDRPLILGAAAALMAATRGRGMWKWAQRGFVAWRAYRALAK